MVTGCCDNVWAVCPVRRTRTECCCQFFESDSVEKYNTKAGYSIARLMIGGNDKCSKLLMPGGDVLG